MDEPKNMSSEMIACLYEQGWRVKNGEVFKPSGELQKLHIGDKGYWVFTVGYKGNCKKRIKIPVHRLVAFQKFGNAIFAKNIVVRHKNNNKNNNNESNILIGTQSDNMMDRDPVERQTHAEKAGKAKRCLTLEQAKSLLEDRKNGMTYEQLAIKYKILKSTISYLVNGRFYKEIQRA